MLDCCGYCSGDAAQDLWEERFCTLLSIDILVFSVNGILSENRRLNLYENLCLKISEITLLKIFDNNLDVGLFPDYYIVDFSRKFLHLIIYTYMYISIEKYT